MTVLHKQWEQYEYYCDVISSTGSINWKQLKSISFTHTSIPIPIPIPISISIWNSIWIVAWTWIIYGGFLIEVDGKNWINLYWFFANIYPYVCHTFAIPYQMRWDEMMLKTRRWKTWAATTATASALPLNIIISFAIIAIGSSQGDCQTDRRNWRRHSSWYGPTRWSLEK